MAKENIWQKRINEWVKLIGMLDHKQMLQLEKYKKALIKDLK